MFKLYDEYAPQVRTGPSTIPGRHRANHMLMTIAPPLRHATISAQYARTPWDSRTRCHHRDSATPPRAQLSALGWDNLVLSLWHSPQANRIHKVVKGEAVYAGDIDNVTLDTFVYVCVSARFFVRATLRAASATLCPPCSRDMCWSQNDGTGGQSIFGKPFVDEVWQLRSQYVRTLSSMLIHAGEPTAT